MPSSKLAYLLCLALCVTCTDLDNISLTETGEAQVVGSDTSAELGGFDFAGLSNIEVDGDQGLSEQGYDTDQVDSVRVVSIVLNITEPSNGYFNFLSEIVFYIEAEGLPKLEIGRLSPVPNRVREIRIPNSDLNIVDYLSSASMNITTEASGVTPRANTTVSATVDLDVDVNVTAAAGCNASSR